MKLIIRQYLEGLRERDELDAILPGVLSELGWTVFSRPGRGTRQDGVDVAAVCPGEAEKVYLFSIKAGNLTRSAWNGNSEQALRPSLGEIQDSYIPSRLPEEHRNKDVVICICLGGDIQETVRSAVKGYIENNTRDTLSFEEWNGDKLASIILESTFREEIMPERCRSSLRKALALIDQPDVSADHFVKMVDEIRATVDTTQARPITVALRQISTSLWILFSWAREEGNIEAAYLAGEMATLYAWEMAKGGFNPESSRPGRLQFAMMNLIEINRRIAAQYLADVVWPTLEKRYALSYQVQSVCSVDVNLKIFDVLGRVALECIWQHWFLLKISGAIDRDSSLLEHDDPRESMMEGFRHQVDGLVQVIADNPGTCCPLSESQGINISLVVFALILDQRLQTALGWLRNIVGAASFAMDSKGAYPCIYEDYIQLIDHPRREEGYFAESTKASVLFPMIMVWAAILKDEELFQSVLSLQEQHLSHCEFQLWYLDEGSEEFLYLNKERHGSCLFLRDQRWESMSDFLDLVFRPCETTVVDTKISAFMWYWPLVLTACRRYGLPFPIHLLKPFRASSNGSERVESSAKDVDQVDNLQP